MCFMNSLLPFRLKMAAGLEVSFFVHLPQRNFMSNNKILFIFDGYFRALCVYSFFPMVKLMLGQVSKLIVNSKSLSTSGSLKAIPVPNAKFLDF